MLCCTANRILMLFMSSTMCDTLKYSMAGPTGFDNPRFNLNKSESAVAIRSKFCQIPLRFM